MDRTVARITLAGLINVLALFFVAGWMVGAHMLGLAGEETAAPFVAVPKRAFETAPVEEPLPLPRNETVHPERSAPPAPPPPASRWASVWTSPSWTVPVRPASYGDLIRNAALDRSLSPSLVEAMARVESGLDPAAVSRRGARGLLQVLPATARRFGFEPERLFEVEHNLAAGATYMAWLLDRYGGDLDRALAAYNAGEGAVDEHDGVPPFPETQEYVRRVRAALNGFEPRGAPDELPEDGSQPFGSPEVTAFEGDSEPPLAGVDLEKAEERDSEVEAADPNLRIETPRIEFLPPPRSVSCP